MSNLMPGVLAYQCTNGKTKATVRTTRSGYIVRLHSDPVVNLTFVKNHGGNQGAAMLEAVNIAESRVFGYEKDQRFA